MKQFYKIVIQKFVVFFRVWKNVIFEWAHNSTENVENEGESANNYKSTIFKCLLVAIHSVCI